MRILKVSTFLVRAFLLLISSGCGSSEPTPSIVNAAVGCSAQTAQIGIGDHYLSILCGCQEESGKVMRPPEDLTCTLPRGSSIFFQYLDTHSAHQIVSIGTPSFIPSRPMLSQDDAIKVRSHRVELTQPGTYFFQDLFQTGLSGRIIIL